jgi:hypothetical protein
VNNPTQDPGIERSSFTLLEWLFHAFSHRLPQAFEKEMKVV